MAKRNKAADAMKKQKEARQKKVLIGLVPLLLLLMVWQGPGMLSAFTGGSAEPPPVLPPEGSTGTTGTGDGAGTALDPATGAAPTTAAPGTSAAVDPAVPASLPETGETVAPGPGQLVSFDRFLGKDPFRPQVVPTETTGGGGGTGAGGGDGDDGGAKGGGGASPPGSGGGGTPPPPPPPPSTYEAAVIEVNGQQQTVAKRGTFPSFDPVFRLLAIRRASIEFGLVSGEFTAGQNRIVVRAGESVTLVSEPDGQRFVVRLVAVG